MKLKLADYVIGFLADKGIDKMFVVYGAANGDLIDDFKIESGDNSIHVLNAPSPGATSSLVIGKYIGNLAAKEFGY